MAKKVVYALTSGEYSDYSVHGICLNRLKAERLAKQSQTPDSYRDHLRVEEIPLLDNAELMPVYTLNFEIDSDGNIVKEWEWSRSALVPHVSYDWYYRWVNSRGFFTMNGANIKRMRKVYSEKKAWLKASEVERRMDHSGQGR